MLGKSAIPFVMAVSAGLAALPVAATAQDGEAEGGSGSGGDVAAGDYQGRFYARFFGGYSRYGAIELVSTALVDSDTQGRVTVEETKTFEEYDTGFNAGFSMGRYVGNGIRVENEYVLRRAARTQGDSDFTTVDPAANDFETSVTTFSIMANGYRDFPIGFGLKYSVGLGAGLSRPSLQASYNSSSRAEFDSSDNVGASWQGMNGIALELSPVFDLYVEGRYFATLPFEVEDKNGNVAETTLSTFDLLAGTTVRF